MLDPSCLICHPIQSNVPNSSLILKFNTFWNWYKSIMYADTYTHNTINEFESLLLNEIELEDENNQNPEKIERIRNRSKVIIERLAGSVRYQKQPPLPLTDISTLVRDCMWEIINLDHRKSQQSGSSRDLGELQDQHERVILNQKFDRFWSWYITITPATGYNDELKGIFSKLMEWDTEVVDTRNRETNRLLIRLISNIIYLRTDIFDKEDVKIQIIDRIVYSQGFRLNDEETERNRERILHESDNDGYHENKGSDTEFLTPILLSPEESELEDDNGNDYLEIWNADFNEEPMVNGVTTELDEDYEDLSINTQYFSSDSESDTTTGSEETEIYSRILEDIQRLFNYPINNPNNMAISNDEMRALLV
ncbi:MAG: hypothetical protein JO131_08295, partial [Gammaproteobacteria bacterium]|nr:hypothetical protein [Gammaproteobacteria bacterium]